MNECPVVVVCPKYCVKIRFGLSQNTAILLRREITVVDDQASVALRGHPTPNPHLLRILVNLYRWHVRPHNVIFGI